MDNLEHQENKDLKVQKEWSNLQETEKHLNEVMTVNLEWLEIQG